jgi:hypothetical protein
MDERVRPQASRLAYRRRPDVSHYSLEISADVV